MACLSLFLGRDHFPPVMQVGGRLWKIKRGELYATAVISRKEEGGVYDSGW